MKIDLQAYENNYHQNGKFIDNWQEGIKLLPFNSNPSSAYDQKCGLQGTTGEFCRIIENDGVRPITDFYESVEMPVYAYLHTYQMPGDQVEEFIRMLKDILYVNGSLNINDGSFLKYLPLVPADDSLSPKDSKKYSDGQKKLASYLYSATHDSEITFGGNQGHNLFIKILKESMINLSPLSDEARKKDYTILPFIKRSFEKDLKWLLEQEESVKVKYIHTLLYFYACYGVTQAIVQISHKKDEPIDKPVPFYFILNSEKASVHHDAVLRGWSYQIPKAALDKLYGKSQALDILNSVLGGNVGFYPEILSKLKETPFEDNKAMCEELLKKYQDEKRAVFESRKSESGSIDEIDITVESYEEFCEKMELLCTGLQSPSYISRMRKKVIDLVSAKFLQSRRGNFVLTIDNEMLTFLIALFTQSNKTKLEDVYKLFNSYGIVFNRDSRIAIENYLLKLNLLDRKSDSGEAQYVKVVL